MLCNVLLLWNCIWYVRPLWLLLKEKCLVNLIFPAKPTLTAEQYFEDSLKFLNFLCEVESRYIFDIETYHAHSFTVPHSSWSTIIHKGSICTEFHVMSMHVRKVILNVDSADIQQLTISYADINHQPVLTPDHPSLLLTLSTMGIPR